MWSRPALVVTLLLLTACGGPGGGGTSSSASCVAPSLEAAPAAVHPGDVLSVTGDYFFATCNDTSADGEPVARPQPLTGLTLTLRQGDRSWTLADRVDASGARWSIAVSVPVPDDVAPGAAEVAVEDHGAPAPITVLPAG